MSVAYGRLAVPAFSSSSSSFSHRHLFRLRHRCAPTFLILLKHLTSSAAAKQTAKATALPAEDEAQTPTPLATSLSFPTLQSLSSHQKDQISLYVRTLLQWNQRMNLTAVTEEHEVISRHVEDSLAILPPLRRSYLLHCCSSSSTTFDGLNVVDVGSGAGLPGVILAIACPSWKVTLLESMKKRCSFLEHIVAVTGLSNVQILCERAEGRMLARVLISGSYLM